MSDSIVVKKTGVGFLSLLTLLFIALKLMGEITWSWWWVLSPLWIPPALTVSGLVVIFILIFAINMLKGVTSRARR